MNKGFKGYFAAGLLVVVPLYITIYVLTVIVGFMDGIFNLFPQSLRPENYLPFYIPGLGILFTLAGVFVIGVLATNFFGRKFFDLGERILARIPILRIVYNATKQFAETFLKKEHEGFRKVVLVEFPRKGVYSMGFLTSRAQGEIQDRTEINAICVFIPTTPNPTSGFLIMVDEKEIITLSMSVEDAFKVIMTGGMVMPPLKANMSEFSGNIAVNHKIQ